MSKIRLSRGGASPTRMREGVAIALAALVSASVGCIDAGRHASPAAEPGIERATAAPSEPPSASAPVIERTPSQLEPAGVGLDCAEPPRHRCCSAMSASCQQCQRAATEAYARWADACGPESEAAPHEAIDCHAPPSRACCQAETPTCERCKAEAAEEQARWRDACASSEEPLP